MKYAMIDTTIVSVHLHATAQRGTQNQSIGKSIGGWIDT